MKFLKIFLGIGWLIFIIVLYFEAHPYYNDSFQYWKEASFLILVWSILIGLWFWVKKWKKSPLVLTPLRGIVFFVFSVCFTGSLLYLSINPVKIFDAPYQVLLKESGEYVLIDEGISIVDGDYENLIVRGTVFSRWNRHPLREKMKGLESHLTSKTPYEVSLFVALKTLNVVGIWIFLGLLFYGFGAFLLRRKTVSALSFFECIGIGMGGIMLIAFLLGILGILRMNYAWGVVGVIFLISFSHVRELLRRLLSIRIAIPLNKVSPLIVTVLLGILTVSLIFLDSIHPFPLGFDSATYYQNRVKLLTEYGHLNEGGSYNFELLQTFGWLLWDDPIVSFSLVILTTFLGLAFCGLLLRRLFKLPQIIEVVVLFLSLTLVKFFLQIDIKIDLPLLFFDLLAIYYALAVVRSKTSKERYSYLMLCGIFLGLILGIKYTALLLILSIFIFWAAELWSTKTAIGMLILGIGILGMAFPLMVFTSFAPLIQAWIYGVLLVAGVGIMILSLRSIKNIKEVFRFIGVALLFAMFSFSPWLFKNGFETNSFHISALLSGKSVAPPAQCSLIPYEDHGRFVGRDSSTHSLFFPISILWESTMNRGITPPNISDISFLFLGFSILVLFHWRGIAQKEIFYKKLTFYTLLYLGLWLITSWGIIWYGFPILLGLLVIYEKVWSRFVWIKPILVAWLGLSLFFSVSDGLARGQYLYGLGLMSDPLYLETVIPGAQAMMTVLNSEKNLNKNIYAVTGSLNYHIRQNDRRIFRDVQGSLDEWECYFENENPLKTLQNLRDKNFGFVVFSDVALNTESDSMGVLHQRFKRFEDFAKQYLILEVYRDQHRLYRVPDV